MYPESLEQFWLHRACRALACDDATAALRALEPDVARLSDLFTTDRTEGFGDYADDPRMQLAYGLFYFPQTFARITLILEECLAAARWHPSAKRPLSVLDLGAGLGAALLAVAQRIRQPLALRATDRSARSLEALRECFDALHAEAWPHANLETHVGDLRTAFDDTTESCDLLVSSFALNEAAESETGDDAPAWLARALDRVTPGGLLVVCEPASKTTSERLERMRDAIAAEGRVRILAPCPHHRPCPLLREGKVYCHEVRRWDLPPSLNYLNQRLQRSAQFLKFSFLALAREPPGRPTGDAAHARLVAPITEETGKLTTRGCADDGEVHRYEILTRHLTRDQREAAAAIERGSRVSWGHLQPLGNGALRAKALPIAGV